MPDARSREWRFYLDDMIDFTEKVKVPALHFVYEFSGHKTLSNLALRRFMWNCRP